MSLKERLSARDNALNFVRFILASIVIIWHAAPILGTEAPGFATAFDWGQAAVNGFFGVSGFLILGSSLRLSLPAFLWRRFLRIFPGLAIVVAITAFIASPLVVYFKGGTWTGAVAGVYFIQHSTVLLDMGWVPWPTAAFDENVLAAAPFQTWNGSLWTLFYEVWAYVLVGLLTRLRVVRENILVTSLLLFSIFLVSQPLAHGPLQISTHLYLHTLRLWSYFFAGMSIYALSARIKASWGILGSSAVCTGLLFFATPEPWWYVQLPYTLFLLTAGAMLPTRIFSKNDISYGMYIYAFPTQQVVAFILGHGANWYAGAFACFLVTAGLAALSWFWVESPALRLKNAVPSRQAAPTAM